jgi:hypothetical protein
MRTNEIAPPRFQTAQPPTELPQPTQDMTAESTKRIAPPRFLMAQPLSQLNQPNREAV